MDGYIAKVVVLLIQRRQIIIAYAIQKKFLPCYLCAEILGVLQMCFLVLRGDLFSMGYAHSCCRAAAAYAPGLIGAAYTYVGFAMTMRYFSSGMMHARYPYHSLLAKWVDSVW